MSQTSFQKKKDETLTVQIPSVSKDLKDESLTPTSSTPKRERRNKDSLDSPSNKKQLTSSSSVTYDDQKDKELKSTDSGIIRAESASIPISKKEDSLTIEDIASSPEARSVSKNRLKERRLSKQLSTVVQSDSVEGSEDDNLEEDEDSDLEQREDYRVAKDKIKREKERLRREEEKLRGSEKLRDKKAREQIRKEKDRLKKEKEETLRKVKEEMKRETQKLYRKNEDMHCGWIKMRTPFKNWILRYFVLVPGKLIYYTNEFEKDCLGIIVLHGCEVTLRESKKQGKCFKIWHPKGANIYSSKGLKGESLASGMVPVSADHCILRVNTDDERTKWIGTLQASINRAINRRASTSKPEDMDADYNSDRSNGAVSPSQSPSTTVEDVPEEQQTSERPLATTNEEISQAVVPVQNKSKKESKIKATIYEPELPEDTFSFSEGPKEEQLDNSSNSLILMLLKQVKIGMDLSRVVLPTFILEPRSMLEKVSDFMTHAELLCLVPSIPDPLDRILGVLKWYVSGFYIKPKGVKKPYNPILGEFFRCKWGTTSSGSDTFYVAEQVSHHPPISAFYSSNRKAGFVINGSILFRSKFLGTSAASILDGFATIYVTPFDEEYEITFPSAYAKGFLFGTLLMELVGPVHIVCKKTGYVAELEFKSKPVIGGEYNVLHAKIKHGNETLYTIRGKWDGQLEIKNAKTKETSILWEPNQETTKNKPIKYKPQYPLMKDFESDKLWKKVTEAIKKGDQNEATDQKAHLEKVQREAAKKRTELGLEYKPRLFRKDENGVWVYKYANRAPFNSEIESEEYEYDGVIRSIQKTEEPVSSDESDDEEENPLIVETPALPRAVSSVAIAGTGEQATVDAEWKRKLENRLLAIEKNIVLLKQQKESHKEISEKKSFSSKKNLAYLLLAFFFVFYFGLWKGN